MKVEVKKIDAVRRELRFEVPRERVALKFDEVYKELGKVAKVKGFRPGKVPRHILESHHAHLAQEEVAKKLIPEVYHEGIEKENLSPVDMPEILDVRFKEGIVTFTAKLDIKPEVKLGEYKGVKLVRKSSEVTEEELSKTLDFLKKGQGKDDQEVALDDAFAHGLGFPNLAEFKKSLSHQMALDKDRQSRMDVENQLIEQLLKKAKLVVPQSLVERQLDRRVHEAEHRLKHQGMNDEDIAKKREDMRKDLREAVEKDVKLYLVLDKIAELEKIETKEGENMPAKVMEFLLKEAKWEEGK